MFPFTITRKAFVLKKALYALAPYDVMRNCFVRLFAECGLQPQKVTATEITCFTSGILDRAASAYASFGTMPGRLLEANRISVRLLSSGDPKVTGVEFTLFLKIDFLSKKKHELLSMRVVRTWQLLNSEMGIKYLDFEAWPAAQSSQSGLPNDCEWGWDFLLEASPLFRNKVLARISSRKTASS